MRENTERPVTVDIGSNTLIGSNRDRLLSALDEVLSGRAGKGQVPDLWDGQAAVRIIDILHEALSA